MANSVNVSGSLTISDAGGYSLVQKNASVAAIVQTGTAAVTVVQSIPTTAAGTALVIPAAVTTAGWGFVRNNDATNYVDLGVQVGGTFYPFVRLYPGHSHPISWGTLTPYALAHTAAVPLEFTIAER